MTLRRQSDFYQESRRKKLKYILITCGHVTSHIFDIAAYLEISTEIFTVAQDSGIKTHFIN